MDPIVALGWIYVVGGAGTLLGATIGFYTSEFMREQKLRTTNRKLNNL